MRSDTRSAARNPAGSSRPPARRLGEQSPRHGGAHVEVGHRHAGRRMAGNGDHTRLDAVRAPRRFGADPEIWPPCKLGPEHRNQQLGHEHQKVSRSEAVFQLLAPDVASIRCGCAELCSASCDTSATSGRMKTMVLMKIRAAKTSCARPDPLYNNCRPEKPDGRIAAARSRQTPGTVNARELA